MDILQHSSKVSAKDNGNITRRHHRPGLLYRVSHGHANAARSAEHCVALDKMLLTLCCCYGRSRDFDGSKKIKEMSG